MHDINFQELARFLQEQDGKRRGDLLHRDQLMAIEAQDRELAKVLQEQERAKAKKAREKARQKALQKKMDHPSQHPDDHSDRSLSESQVCQYVARDILPPPPSGGG
ncbi:hypothetical protein SK128_027594 [Halocaridina rubra]|uniref:Uncharacterized protein n=1 Tax=Halocaridina rubra TaxID=373956 RepID=A0AAN8WLZ6_HALRR